MVRDLDFRALEQDPGADDQGVSAQPRRWGRRDANPTVQMSVRMREDVYEKFREVATKERYTNGELLERMITMYLLSKQNRS